MSNVDPASIQRPSLALPCAEPFRAATEFAWHRFGKSHDAKPGDGHPVVIFPGLGTDGKSVATLRKRCRALGYEAFDWGQGFNTGPQGDFDTWLRTLKSRTVELLSGHTQPATLIDWSLGGLYAREIGKLMAPWCGRVADLSPPQTVRTRTRHRSRRQPCRHELEPGCASGSRGPPRPAARAMAPICAHSLSERSLANRKLSHKT